ncbi:MAG: hypothetical protein HZB26_14225 [Candidatus Hydrogenedentes bacterium]|nr:hypothetical protein [Candidatus Hydrogenedentota bacterium]
MPINHDHANTRLAGRGFTDNQIRKWLELHKRAHFAAKYFSDRNGNPWKPRHYQTDSLESFATRKVHCDGRDVGKTMEIEIMAAWALVAHPDSELLIATQCENHLFPLMNRLVRRFESTPQFMPSLVEIKRTPSWFLRFSNGFVLWGRIAGPRGVNFQGLHVDWQIVDEAQEMTETGWSELLQALNGDGSRWIYGVPNGLRNTFYRMTQMQTAEQYNWPSSLNPEFTAEKDAELALLYGGRTSPGYIHRVLGQHGEPEHAVFKLDDYLACVDEGLDCADLSIGEEDSFAAPPDIPAGDYYLGCDLGYARDPSEFVVYRAAPPHLVNVLRIHLHGVNYARQQQIIQELDKAYDFRGIGVDNGNSGRAVTHNLLEDGAVWGGRVQGFEFGANLDLEPHPDGTLHRRQTKQFMTELLERALADRSIVFPRIPDREAQYASHTYSIGLTGNIIYTKGNDHLIDADRCAILIHYLDTHLPEPTRGPGMRVEGF